jgi:hypothetical protein
MRAGRSSWFWRIVAIVLVWICLFSGWGGLASALSGFALIFFGINWWFNHVDTVPYRRF